MWNKIEELLKERQMSVYRLAKLINVPIQTLLNIKKGDSKHPSFELMERIANALDVSLDEFRDK